MTVITTTNKVVALGDGANKTFTYAFLIPTTADVQIIYTDAAGTATTLNSSQYTITGIGTPGGVVTYPLVGSAIASGTTLTIARQLSLIQPTSISNQGAFYPEVVEGALDLLCMEIQQVASENGRAITVPVSDINPVTVLPPAAQRANKVLLFDGAGNPTAGSVLPAGTVSAIMQPVVNAATLAVGRVAFGLKAMATEGIGAGLQDDGAGSARVNFTLVTKSANYPVASTDHDISFITTGNIVFTLPATSTLWSGFGFWVASYSGTLTLTPNAADSVEGNATGASSYVPSGAKAYIYTDGSGSWHIDRSESPYSSITPGGYLTPTSGTPVITVDVIGGTNLYYTSDAHGLIPIYNGAEWINYPFTELSCALNAAQQTSNGAYDVFVSLQSGVPTLVIGPAWRQSGYNLGQGGFTSLSNTTPIICAATGHNLQNGDVVYFTGVFGNKGANGAWVVSGVSGASFTLTGTAGTGAYTSGTGTFASRGNGAGTSQLSRLGGLNVNAVQMIAYNGTIPYTIAANQATYVGSILIDATSGQITCHKSYGQTRRWAVWNAYNRKNVALRMTDPTASWTYAGQWRISDGDASNYLTTFTGLAEEEVSSKLVQTALVGINPSYAEIGYASNATGSGTNGMFAQNAMSSTYAIYDSAPTIGMVAINSLERAYQSTTFYGQAGTMILVSSYRG